MTPEQKLQSVRNSIAEAESRYQRDSGSVRLIGVGKVHSAESIRAIVNAGLNDIAENYVQEALVKQQQLKDLNIIWHYIGHIQSNKTRDVAENFDWVQSVDRLKIARRLSDQRPVDLPELNICLQVNLQEEPNKSGFTEKELFEVVDTISALPKLRLRGLMAIPRLTTDFKEQRKIFKLIRTVYNGLRSKGLQMDTLSMGMSEDMEAAIAEGATMVRIGTALFGPRQTKAGLSTPTRVIRAR
ncbi:MAG: YggS family pyridoxal phosphate-dependent enzyme [Arenicellales bacterium]|nr:YggS family pyridoxal phosphate-dependent enzyme [Arenicellales bacterium]